MVTTSNCCHWFLHKVRAGAGQPIQDTLPPLGRYYTTHIPTIMGIPLAAYLISLGWLESSARITRSLCGSGKRIHSIQKIFRAGEIVSSVILKKRNLFFTRAFWDSRPHHIFLRRARFIIWRNDASACAECGSFKPGVNRKGHMCGPCLTRTGKKNDHSLEKGLREEARVLHIRVLLVLI